MNTSIARRALPALQKLAVAAICVGACLEGARGLLAQSRDMVVFNQAGGGFPSRDLSVYDLRLRRYDEDDLDKSFCRRVAAARMLYIGQYARGAAGRSIFGDAERVAAVVALLRSGGLLFFDYNGGCDGHIQEFFKKVGLKHPGYPKGKYYDCATAPDSRSPFLAGPHRLRGKMGRAFGWWENWPKDYDAPVRHADSPDRAAMLVKTGVEGKGTIILTRVPSIFRDSAKDIASKKLAENIIAYAFGSLPGPGQTVAVYDPFHARTPAANALYLRNAAQVRWHVDEADWRVPLLVAEPVGLARRSAPVSLVVDLPGRPDSILLLTPWGERIPCQVTPTQQETQTMECTIEADLDGHETQLLFLYGAQTPVQRLAAPDGFALLETSDGYLLRNDKIRVTLYKDRPSFGQIKPTGSDTSNELATWGGVDMGKGNWLRLSDGEFEPGVIEDGALRKRVRYSSPKLTVTYTLYARTGALFYSMQPSGKLSVSRFTGWAPRGDGDEDALFYETPTGLKKLRLRGGTFYRPFGNIRQFMKEGWLAIEDARGEVVGEFSDLRSMANVSTYHHMVNGNTITVSTKLQGQPECGAFVTARGDHTTVRKAYIAWKNPPAIVIGRPQPRSAAKPPGVPRLGKQFLLIHGGTNWFNATCTVSDPATRARRLLTELERMGGNFLVTSTKRPEFLSQLIPAAHTRGMGVCVRPTLEGKGKRPCPVAKRDLYVEAVRRASQFDVDGLYLVDEYEFHCTCDRCQAAFEKAYGLGMPGKMDFAKLAQPAYHNLMFFRMNAITDLIRDMTQAGKQKRPDSFYFHVTSPNNHYRPVGYHDLETQSDYLTATCSDLYSTNLDATKYMMKHIRGAQGNSRPVLTVNGCLYDARQTRVNAKMHLLAGSNALWHFSLTFMRTHRDVTEANAKVFRWLRYTGLGEVLAQCHPVKYLAVLRDRDAFMDSMRRGESTGNLTDYERRIRDLCLMQNVPTDILFSKYLSRAELATYRIVIVPSERVLPDERANVIAEYVRAGGHAIIEGEAARNAVMAQLCHVQPAEGKLLSASKLKGVAAPLDGLDTEVASKLLPVSHSRGDLIATADDRPAAIVVDAGKGKVAYVALTQMPTHVVKRLVRFLAGERPVEVPEQLEEQIETNVLTDGKGHVIVAYNPHYSERRVGTLDTSTLLAPAGSVAIDFERGAQRECEGKVEVDLAPGGFEFVMIASPQDWPMPKASAQATAGPPAHSANPGMKFLRIEAPPEPQSAEREKEPDKIYVAIFKTAQSPLSGVDMGAAAMMEALKKQPGIAAEHIIDDRPRTLAFYDVVVIPNMKRRAPNLSEHWQRNVRACVERGGGALLVHHSAGYPSTTPPVFPEIATAPDYVPVMTMEVAADHPIATGASLRARFKAKAEDPAFAQYFRATELKVGHQFQSGFADYIKLVPGKSGQTVVKSAVRGNLGGDAVVVAGRAGKGKVVLSGMNIGCRSTKVEGKYSFEEHVTPGELAVLVNSVFWLAERK